MIDSTGQASMTRLLGIFTLTWVAIQVALIAATYFFPELPLPDSIGIVMAMIAAMISGQSYARQTGRRPTGSEKLVFALIATLIAVALSVAAVWGIFRYYAIALTLENVIFAATGDAAATTEIAPYLTIGAAVVGALSLFLCWLGFGMGAKGQLKQMERAAGRG